MSQKILMIVYTDYATDARIRREAETLVEHGFDVSCFLPMDGGPRHEEVNGVQLRRLKVRKYQGKSTKAYIWSYFCFMLAAFIACIGTFLVFAALVPRILGRKLILDVHDTIPETFTTKFGNSSGIAYRLFCWEEKFSSKLAHKIICVNHPQREVLVSRGVPLEKTFISLNSPDPKAFVARPGQFKPLERTFHLVYHGTMAKRLGVDLIIRAVGRLASEIPELKLHLWGYGDDLREFRQIAEEVCPDGIVEFKDRGVPFPELPAALRQMDLGVVGNRRSVATELMLPVKMLEYVAMGIPVVTPRLRTIEHYFTEEMAAFYEPEDIDDLADRIRELYRAPERRKQQVEAARKFLNQYGWETHGKEFVQFYRSLLEG